MMHTTLPVVGPAAQSRPVRPRRKMRWLLTNCAAPLMAPFDTTEKRPPLGIGFLAGALRQAGHEVVFIDNYLQPSDFTKTDYLVRNKIDAVGISVSTICAEHFYQMLRDLKRMRDRGTWRGLVAVGGPHVMALPESIPDWVDHVVRGEGEDAIVDIADGAAPREVKTARTKDLDALAPPAWDLFAHLPYDWGSTWIDSRPVFTMNTSRGCPFTCNFCSVPANWGKQYRYFSADWVVEQMQHLVRTYGCKGIYFREDNFTVHKRRVTDFCQKMLEADVPAKWICETRVDTLTRDLVQLMHDAGCRAIYVGVESGSQRLLDMMTKNIKIEQVEAVFAWCREIGVNTYASMITGVPGETEDDRRQSRELLERIRPTNSSTGIFVGIPKSDLYQKALDDGLAEYIDPTGMVYLKGHDERVDVHYGGNEARKIPTPARRAFVLSRRRLAEGRRLAALGSGIATVLRAPQRGKYWRQLWACLTGRVAFDSEIERQVALAAAIKRFATRQPQARRLVVYGVGRNGQALLKELRTSNGLGRLTLAAADDHADPAVFGPLGLPREDPRQWTAWPADAVAVVTPNECDQMRSTLERAGGREGREFVTLASLSAV